MADMQQLAAAYEAVTEYFANPFPAPEWRSAFVEKL